MEQGGQGERSKAPLVLGPWHLVSRLAEISSPWLTVVAERFEEVPGKRPHDYWRIEKPDSVVAITILRDRLVLPPRSYRPGAGRVTLDLAGGRIEGGRSVSETAAMAVRREFGFISESSIASVTVLNETGWDVDSSTSNHRLYGAVVELAAETDINPLFIGASYPLSAQGAEAVISDLNCLQCREALREWLSLGMCP